MFDKLKTAAQGAMQTATDGVKTVAAATAEAVSVEAQVNRALSLMERAATETAKRRGVRSFRVTTRVDLGLIDIGLEVEYDSEALLKE